MKILLLTQIFPEPDDIDGYVPTKTVAYFARDWVKLGNEVMVVHCQSKFPIIYYLIPRIIKQKLLRNSYALLPSIESRKTMHRNEDGIDIYRLPMKKAIPSMAFSEGEMDSQVKRITEICRDVAFIPELVAGHFANPCLELTARLGQIFHSKTSFVFHNDCNPQTIEKYRIEKYIDQIDILGGRSRIEAHKIKELLKLSYTPFVCYSGVPDEMVLNTKTECIKHDTNCMNILYAGGLVKKKHVDSVIKAAQYLNQATDIIFNLTIVGGGAEESNLKNLANQCNLDNKTCFTGRLARSEVALKMKEANVFVMISEGETFGMVYLEAMLQGCIVIASSGGGFDGIIRDGENGFLCPPGDDICLHELLLRINGLSSFERNKIGEAAIKTAIGLSETKVASMYLDDVCNR